MAKATTQVTELHSAVKRGDLVAVKALLDKNPGLANARSETDPRGTFPLHVAAEFGQAGAAKLLLDHGADVSARELENDAIALGWAAPGANGSGFPMRRSRTGDEPPRSSARAAV